MRTFKVFVVLGLDWKKKKKKKERKKGKKKRKKGRNLERWFKWWTVIS